MVDRHSSGCPAGTLLRADDLYSFRRSGIIGTPPLLIAVTMSMSSLLVIVLYVIIQNMQDYLITIPIHRRNPASPILIIFFQFFRLVLSASGVLLVSLWSPLLWYWCR